MNILMTAGHQVQNDPGTSLESLTVVQKVLQKRLFVVAVVVSLFQDTNQLAYEYIISVLVRKNTIT